MTPRPAETAVIAKVAEDYRRRGYEVDVRPDGPSVPDFLDDFHPDIIARSPTETVVVEVKVGTDRLSPSQCIFFAEITRRTRRTVVLVNVEILNPQPAPD